MNYKQTLEYLLEHLPMFQRVGPAAYKKDLGNIVALCDAIGNPENSFKSIHIAGTNGKGSVSNMLAAIFQASGYKTGLYTSPHLVDFRERIRVNGVLCDEAFVVDFVAQHRVLIESIKPSFFEITVAMAFGYFKEQQCEVAIIETGLGGRLDSTNIIHPELSIITNIGWDHMQMLGDTLPKIAAEKAGIIKKNTPVIIGEMQEEVSSAFNNKAIEKEAQLMYADDLIKFENIEQTYGSTTLYTSYLNEPAFKINIPLGGVYQLKNIKTTLASAHTLVKEFELSQSSIYTGLNQLRELTGFRGRMDVLHENPLIMADCAHNIDGIENLLSSIDMNPFEQVYIVYGTVEDKDAMRVLNQFPQSATFCFCRPDIPRGKSLEGLEHTAKKLNLKYNLNESVVSAVQKAKDLATSADLVLICGSIFVVAEYYASIDSN